MAVSDLSITLACFLKWEAPDGDVLICDGGFLEYASETYSSQHGVYGSIMAIESVSAGFGDIAEGGKLVFAPNPDAALADWWRTDLFDSRIRLWLGEVSGKTVSTATLLADWLVDNVERVQGQGGQNLLSLDLMARSEKLFLKKEGNVCSERHHTSVWPGELGFRNATDLQGFVAWGSANPPRSAGSSGGSSSNNAFGVVARL